MMLKRHGPVRLDLRENIRNRRVHDARSRWTSVISHRGPDDCGYFREGQVGLGHRRLSIIDLEGGHQPMFNEDRTVAVVFNGEIYNFAEIAADLRAKGHIF